MMKLWLLSWVLVSAPTWAISYTCQLKARQNVMEDFETAEKVFSGEMPVEIRLQNFRLRFQTVVPGGVEQLSMLLGTQSKSHSAVTMAPLGQESVYLNFIDEERFAVGECQLTSRQAN